MQNQITKTIACALAGLSLTACGGSGGAPAGTVNTQTETMEKIPTLPQIGVGKAYYIGTLTTSLSSFRNVSAFRIDVDFDNRTLEGGESDRTPARIASSFNANQYSTLADFNFACAVARNTYGAFRSGNLCITPGREAVDYNLAVSGTFTQNGAINGKVEYERCAPTCPRFPDTANLTGTISAQTIVGRFDGDFSGGFSADRQ